MQAGDASSASWLSFSPADLKQWFVDNGQHEAGDACLDLPLTGSDFAELVASGEGKKALEELGVKEVLQRHKICKIWLKAIAAEDTSGQQEGDANASKNDVMEH